MWVKPTKENLDRFDPTTQFLLVSLAGEAWVSTATEFPRGALVSFVPKPPSPFKVADPKLPLA